MDLVVSSERESHDSEFQALLAQWKSMMHTPESMHHRLEGRNMLRARISAPRKSKYGRGILGTCGGWDMSCVRKWQLSEIVMGALSACYYYVTQHPKTLWLKTFILYFHSCVTRRAGASLLLHLQVSWGLCSTLGLPGSP